MRGIDGPSTPNFHLTSFGSISVSAISHAVAAKKHSFDRICGPTTRIFKYVPSGDDKIEYFVARFCKYGRICPDYGILGHQRTRHHIDDFENAFCFVAIVNSNCPLG